MIKHPNLVGYWPLEGNANDASGNGRNGTVIGATVNENGKFGKCYGFNGSSQYIDCRTNPIIGTGAFTLMAWINTNSVGGYSGALSIGSATNACAYIGTVGTAQVGTSNSIGGGIYSYNIGSGIATTGAWVHLTLVSLGSGVSNGLLLYINGNVKRTGTRIYNLNSTSIKIGAIGSDTAYKFNGLIDNPKLYNIALSEYQIRQDMLNFSPYEF